MRSFSKKVNLFTSLIPKVFCSDIITLWIHNCIFSADYTKYISRIISKIFFSGENVKKKWKNLRDTYIKFLKTSKKKENLYKNYRNWQWADHMEEFKPYMPISKPESSTSEQPVEEETSEHKFSHSIQLSDSAPESDIEDPLAQETSKTDNDYEYTESHIRSTSSIIEHKESKRSIDVVKEPVYSFDTIVQKRQKFDLSPLEMIFLGYARTIETFSPKRQAKTKLKIAQLIMEQELQHYEEK